MRSEPQSRRMVRRTNGVTFHSQTLWGSIGWATPAAFGVAAYLCHI